MDIGPAAFLAFGIFAAAGLVWGIANQVSTNGQQGQHSGEEAGPTYEFNEDGNLLADGVPADAEPEGTPEVRTPQQVPPPHDGKTPGPEGPGLWKKIKYYAAQAARAFGDSSPPVP